MVENYKEVLYDNETLTAERIILRKFRKNDAGDILAYGSDDETLKYLVWDGAHTIDEALKCITEYYWSKPGVYAIELIESERCIGCIELRLLPEHDKAGFGYVLNRQYWGKGYMAEALSAVMRLCFEKLELNRIESTHFIGNESSGKVMKKCGMELEGIGIQEVRVKGIYHDVAHYGITRRQWVLLWKETL